MSRHLVVTNLARILEDVSEKNDSGSLSQPIPVRSPLSSCAVAWWSAKEPGFYCECSITGGS